MSRIGKLPIHTPKGVTVKLEGDLVSVTGPNGNLSRRIPPPVSLDIQSESISVIISSDSKTNRALHGLFRTLLNNMVLGVNKKFEVDLQLKGVGYRCQTGKDKITLSLGFSHPIDLLIPVGVEVQVDANTNIKILGIDKEAVGFFASKIRSFRPPEPYNGKGVLYKGEILLRKAGKVGKK